MPTKCEECEKESYCIYLTPEFKKLCGECYDKTQPERKFEADDIPYRNRCG